MFNSSLHMPQDKRHPEMYLLVPILIYITKRDYRLKSNEIHWAKKLKHSEILWANLQICKSWNYQNQNAFDKIQNIILHAIAFLISNQDMYSILQIICFFQVTMR